MDDNLVNSKEIKLLYNDIAGLINGTKEKVYRAVNTELINLYWNIGKIIKEDIIKKERAEYGKQIIDNLSKELTNNYGNGYSRSNLFRMVQFYEAFSTKEIVATLSQQLTWSHIKELISLEDNLEREFYATMCNAERWSVRTLRERIGSMMYERTVISKKPEQTIVNDLKLLREENKMTPDLFFKDPYVLDFLGLEDTYSEKDLENAILAELEKFILEMGSDFAFLGRQKRITIDDEDYYIDLLFYHRKMRRLVAVELKLDKFKPEHKGQVELYLRWLNKHERNEGEEAPIGLILCAKKSQETVELLELDKSGIHVAQYITQLPPKEVFEEKLHKAIVKARLQLEQRNNNSEI
jgi:predicted nuclease of restriction endonuclease-like (RecB) superfamily